MMFSVVYNRSSCFKIIQDLAKEGNEGVIISNLVLKYNYLNLLIVTLHKLHIEKISGSCCKYDLIINAEIGKPIIKDD